MLSTAPKLDDYWNTFQSVLSDFSPEQQHTAVTLYRELAKGRALSTAAVASALGVSQASAGERLARDPIRSFVYTEGEQIVGFGGLATAQMHHEFRVSERTLWTWCAWDSLFIPAILGESAEVSSTDPETKALVRLSVAPGGIESAEPGEPVVSFRQPDADGFDSSAANVMSTFCHHVFLFESRESGERWQAGHDGTFLYSLTDAFELGQRLVTRQFGHELGRRSATSPATSGDRA